ncbi:hypothetical protein AX15_007915 [Amanita polypyramis BW_CC]|nr:hypothetical protein AX15_007915 [Amanita polypyramis BW_CC]
MRPWSSIILGDGMLLMEGRCRDLQVRMMKEYTLNVSSCHYSTHVQQVSIKLHRAFDSAKWLLLPETSIIDTYYNARSMSKFPNIEVRIISFNIALNEVVILRCL